MAQATRPRAAVRRLSLPGRAATLGLGGLAVSIIAASCGGTASTHTAKSVVISTAQSATVGTVLVSGNTLYTLKPSQTPCTAECMKVWPEVLLPQGVTAATAGPGVSDSKFGTVARAGGVLQVTYSGQALYRFSGDTAPGQVNGNITDEWGTWSDVVTARPAAASPSPASVAPVPSTPMPTTAPTQTPAPTPAPTPTTAPASGGAGF
jgi:predicted lipoprotein with Yx(FWY)xxD motif